MAEEQKSDPRFGPLCKHLKEQFPNDHLKVRGFFAKALMAEQDGDKTAADRWLDSAVDAETAALAGK